MSDKPCRRRIVHCRAEILIALKLLYPPFQQARTLYRVILLLFPRLRLPDFLQDLAYLIEKGHVRRLIYDLGSDPEAADWSDRWFTLTPPGLEIADHLVSHPALEV